MRLVFGNPEHIALRRKAEAELEEKEKLALCNDCDSDGLTDCPACKGTGDCAECDGDSNCCATGGKCAECNGTGKVKCEHPSVVLEDEREYEGAS